MAANKLKLLDQIYFMSLRTTSIRDRRTTRSYKRKPLKTVTYSNETTTS